MPKKLTPAQLALLRESAKSDGTRAVPEYKPRAVLERMGFVREGTFGKIFITEEGHAYLYSQDTTHGSLQPLKLEGSRNDR